jgi:predicted NACHT family NTPase
MDSEAVLDELRTHGFSSFVEHPLMLTLVCILKSSSSPNIPRRAIGLVRRAIDTLTWRWDEQKGISREAEVPLDGEERVRCLMRVAFGMNKLEEIRDNVEGLVRDYLKLAHLKNIDVGKFLNEIARWYGILVPTANDGCSFVHRTIHDYLAARYWVESNAFTLGSIKQWDTRAAYASCLIPDATQHLCGMLGANELGVFTECLYNQPSFRATEVAIAVVSRMDRTELFKIDYGPQSVKVNISQDWFSLASDELLQEIAIIGFARAGLGAQAAALYSLAELSRRKGKFKSANLRRALDSGHRAKSGYLVEVERSNGKAYSFSPLEVVLPESC